MELKTRHILVGLATWVVIFGVFILLAGPTEFIDATSTLSRTQLAGILGMKALGTIFMGFVLYTVSRGAGLEVGPVESIFLNTTVSLVNNFTPFGQASGLPAGGLVMSRWTGDSFENCLAALSMKELVGLTPGILVMLFGGSYIALYNPVIPDRVRSLVAVFTVSIGVFVIVVGLVYRNPDPAIRLIHRFVAALNRGLGYLPWISPIDETEVRERVDSFTGSVDKISSNKPIVVVAATFTTLATITQGALLWIALEGVGVDVSLVLVIFIVPVSLLASAIPTPGGSGGIEGAQILLIIAMTSGGRTQIITAVIITRGLVYWTPIVIGSLTLAGIQVKRWRRG